MDDETIGRLERLSGLRDRGVITDEQFERERAKLLDGQGQMSRPSAPNGSAVNTVDFNPQGTIADFIASMAVDDALDRSAASYRKRWTKIAQKAGVLDRPVSDSTVRHSIARQLSWNWAAFFLTLFWMNFRRLPRALAVVVVYMVLLVLIYAAAAYNQLTSPAKILIDLLGIGICLLFGLLGNSWLFLTILSEASAKPPRIVRHKSWWRVWAAIGLFITLSLLIELVNPAILAGLNANASANGTNQTANTDTNGPSQIVAPAPTPTVPAPTSTTSAPTNTSIITPGVSPDAASQVPAPTIPDETNAATTPSQNTNNNDQKSGSNRMLCMNTTLIRYVDQLKQAQREMLDNQISYEQYKSRADDLKATEKLSMSECANMSMQ